MIQRDLIVSGHNLYVGSYSSYGEKLALPTGSIAADAFHVTFEGSDWNNYTVRSVQFQAGDDVPVSAAINSSGIAVIPSQMLDYRGVVHINVHGETSDGTSCISTYAVDLNVYRGGFTSANAPAPSPSMFEEAVSSATAAITETVTEEVMGEIEDTLYEKANVDGYYSTLGAGTAEQLIPTTHTDNRTPYVVRSTGGGVAGIGTRKKVKKLIGGSIAWNQQVGNGNFANTSGWTSNIVKGTTLRAIDNTLTITATTTSSRIWRVYSSLLQEIPEDHVVVGKAMMQRKVSSVSSGSAITGYKFGVGEGSTFEYITTTSVNAVNDTVDMSGVIKLTTAASRVSLEKDTCKPASGSTVFAVWNVQVFDVTTMFGEDIANHVYALEQANAGAGVAWFNTLFPEDYYGGIEANIQSVKTAGQVTRDANNATIETYPTTAKYLRGIPKLDENNNLYYDGDEYLPTGIITRNYEEREYESGDESLANAITDGFTTVVARSTPTTETALAYSGIQIIAPDGTEQYMDADVMVSNRDVAIPVGHETEYYADLVADIERIVAQVPAPPSANGSYHLAVTVANGVATYSWEAD